MTLQKPSLQCVSELLGIGTETRQWNLTVGVSRCFPSLLNYAHKRSIFRLSEPCAQRVCKHQPHGRDTGSSEPNLIVNPLCAPSCVDDNKLVGFWSEVFINIFTYEVECAKRSASWKWCRSRPSWIKTLRTFINWGWRRQKLNLVPPVQYDVSL